MSKAPRRFDRRIYGTMHESPHGDWVRYGDLALATQRAEAAEAERDRANVAAAWCAEQADKDATEAMQLRVEREALRKDAARLDWMESERVLRASFYPLCFPPCWVVEASEVTSGETLRVAIDAAMLAQPTTGEGA